MKTSTIPKRVLAALCAFLILCVCLSSAVILSVSANSTVEDYELPLSALGAQVGTFNYDEASDVMTIDYSGQMWGYWTLWSTDRWATDQSAVDISAYKYLTMEVEMVTGNPFAVAAAPTFNLCNDGGVAISNPWVGATVDTTRLAKLAVGEKTTVSLPLDTSTLSSIYYLIMLADQCGAGQIKLYDMRLTEDDRTVVPDYELPLSALGAQVGTFNYDEASDVMTIDYSGQMWGYWTLWSTDRWATDQSAVDISAYKYLTMEVEMVTGNPFAVAAAPTFNLCNDGGVAISNPWVGAAVDYSKLSALTVGGGKATVSLPLDTSTLSSFYYLIMLTDQCGAGQIKLYDMRLTQDDRTTEQQPVIPDEPEPVEDFVMDVGIIGSGNGANGGTYTYDAENDVLTIDYSGQMWGYWMLWSTDRWATDQSAVDISAYKYLTMEVEMVTGNPFAVAAAPTLNLCNDGGVAINNPWTGAAVDYSKLSALTVGGGKATVSLPLDTSTLSSFYYLIMLTDQCGAGQIKLYDMRLTEDDRTTEQQPVTPDESEPVEDFVMDLDALGAGNGDPTKYTYDPETGIGHVEYTNQMWLYWTLWSSDRWATNQNPVNLTNYNYLTMKVRMDKSNAFAATSAPAITLANDGGVAVNNPWNGLGVYTARLEAITEADGWVTVSLPFKTSETTSAYYAMLLCDMCGNGSFSIADMRLTEDDRTDEAFKNVGGDEANPYDDLILDLGAWGTGYDSTVTSYDSHTGILKADYSGMLWLYWTSWSDKSYTGTAFNTADYEYLTMTLREDENNPFATAFSLVFNLCNDGGVAINNPYTGVQVPSALLKTITQDNGWVTLSLPLKDSADKDFWYAMLQAENCGEGTLEIKDCRLTRDDRTSIYTGEEWDPAKGIWLDVTGWSNHYPQGVTGTNNIFDDSLKLDVHGNLIYCWAAWSSEQAENVVDFSDYPYLTMDVCLTGGNPFKNSSDAGLGCGLFIGDEGGISVSYPYDFGSALMDNLCQVRPGDEWVTVSLSLENVEQSTLRYIYMVAENCGVDMSVLIRNMRLTENDETPDFIKKRVEDAKNADKGDASEEESFFDPDDVLDDYSGREEQQPSDESSAPEEDVESSKPADDSSDPVDTGVVLPVAAMLIGALSLGAVSVLRKKRR